MSRAAVRELVAAADALRAIARGLETIELASADRADLRLLVAGIRREALLAVAIAAVEVGGETGPRTRPAAAE